jgi:hypothetical protein
MRKFSAGQNPEGAIGDVPAHSARFMTQHRRSRSFGLVKLDLKGVETEHQEQAYLL